MLRRGLRSGVGFIAAAGAFGLVAASSTAAVAACDEDNPASPSRNTQIVLSTADSVDESRNELRTFVMTGSLGRVEASIVSASPPGAVLRMTATPQISRISPDFGEQLKGIGIVATLKPGRRAGRVVVRVRQVCAQYFRDSFLYE
jgi:hypothetical protein